MSDHGLTPVRPRTTPLEATLAEVYAQACTQRDRALLDLQAARAAVAYWQARAEGR